VSDFAEENILPDKAPKLKEVQTRETYVYLEHHLSRWLDTAFLPTSPALDSLVSFFLSNRFSLVSYFNSFLSGGDKGSTFRFRMVL
jgi:hypothetical protein